MIRLEDTSGGDVATAITRERHRMGSPTTGMVLTLLILADESTQSDATAAAVAAARLHPMRIVTFVPRPADRHTRLDAEISVGGDDGPGEVAVIRLRGLLAEHANSVAVPLLLPDTPVVAYWPAAAPEVPGDDPIGRHAQRRITDAASSPDPLSALLVRQRGYQPGDTDLSWTRLTPWRSLLATVFDGPIAKVQSGTVRGEVADASVLLLATWLEQCLRIAIDVEWGAGPGITSVSLGTRSGELRIERPDGRTAVLQRPGIPQAQLALPRRDLASLLAEELRRLDPDEIYQRVIEGVRHG